MKKVRFKTSKGSWLVLDSKDAPSSFNRYLRDIEKELRVRLAEGYKLSEITEEQASEIVDCIDENISCKTSLNILLKSKGYHLFENPLSKCISVPSSYNFGLEQLLESKNKAEQNTFYNPYIFKI